MVDAKHGAMPGLLYKDSLSSIFQPACFKTEEGEKGDGRSHERYENLPYSK